MYRARVSRADEVAGDGRLAARGKRENSGSEMPFLTVKITGETPVPQFCHRLLAFLKRRSQEPGGES